MEEDKNNIGANSFLIYQNEEEAELESEREKLQARIEKQKAEAAAEEAAI